MRLSSTVGAAPPSNSALRTFRITPYAGTRLSGCQRASTNGRSWISNGTAGSHAHQGANFGSLACFTLSHPPPFRSGGVPAAVAHIPVYAFHWG
jgi:hypothetical protein